MSYENYDMPRVFAAIHYGLVSRANERLQAIGVRNPFRLIRHQFKYLRRATAFTPRGVMQMCYRGGSQGDRRRGLLHEDGGFNKAVFASSSHTLFPIADTRAQ